MAGDRLVRILREVSAQGGDGPEIGRLCQVAVELTGTSGAGVMLVSGDVPQGTLYTTNAVSALLEDLQYTLGEGPCVDAHRYGVAVAEPDLAAPDRPRWTGFGPAAVKGGARAVFGFPVRVGAARLGALNLYRDQPGALDDDQHADALVLGEVVARAVLTMQADAPPGRLAAEVEAEGNFQFVVHQAAGMVSMQLGVGVAQALVRLRAYAFGTGDPLVDVARNVVNRVLRFDETSRN
jgi:hypothetical protein